MHRDIGIPRDVDTQRKQPIDFLRASTKRRELRSKESILSEMDEFNKLQHKRSVTAKKNLDGDPASLNPHVDLIARVWGENDSRVKELRKKFQDLQELNEQLAEAKKGYDDKPKKPESEIHTELTRFFDEYPLEPVMLPYIERLQKGETVSKRDEEAQALLKECTSLRAQGYIKYINEEAQHFYDNQGQIDQTQGKKKQELISDVAAHMECALAYYHNYKDFLSHTNDNYDGKPKYSEHAISIELTRFLNKHQQPKSVMQLYIKDKQAQALLKECTSLSAQGYIKYINEEAQHFYDNQGQIDQTQGKKRRELISDAAAHIECALAYYHNYKDFSSHTNDKIDKAAEIYSELFKDISRSLKEIEISILESVQLKGDSSSASGVTPKDDEPGPRTDGESHKHSSGTELRRTLPRTDVIRKDEEYFSYITKKAIRTALHGLRENREIAKSNIDEAKKVGNDFFVQRHSRTKERYDEAYKDMKDFRSLWRDSKSDLASAKWEEWVQASQSDQPNADVATLITNTIYDAMGLKHPRAYEYTDINRIRPLEQLLKCHDERERQHWEKVLEVHYGGEFKGLRGENAINEFYRELEIHAKNLIKDAKIFRLIHEIHFALVLDNWDRKFPTTQKYDSYTSSKNQAMYGSSEFPIHAYMSDSENGTLPPNRETPIKSMGSVILRLKKDQVMGRATLAFDDTMGHYWEVANELTVVPRPMTQLDRKVWPLTKREVAGAGHGYVDEAVLSQVENPLAVRHLGDLENYPEVQIHGDLKLSDVEKIFVPPDFKEDPSLLQQLDECGIEWEYL